MTDILSEFKTYWFWPDFCCGGTHQKTTFHWFLITTSCILSQKYVYNQIILQVVIYHFIKYFVFQIDKNIDIKFSVQILFLE
jgi:hypothetical protein